MKNFSKNIRYILRKILFPFSILYHIITSCRNFLYDCGVLKSFVFETPLVIVGNLSVGGTGKTPQIEYLIRLLQDSYQLATLSRGYKRTSKGFVLANATTNVTELGDEPFQFYTKFKKIMVAVDANRKNGIEQLHLQKKKPEVILLDDAFQHRKVTGAITILLTTYENLYVEDYLLPTGNLRESSAGAKRADFIMVTKCPEGISEKEQKNTIKKLKITSEQSVYFTKITYDTAIYSEKDSIEVSKIISKPKILLAGIANPTSFFDYLKGEKESCLSFPDHHNYTPAEIEKIKKQAINKLIITTEKDYVRLKDSELKEQLYYLPIKTSFVNNQDSFDNSIKNKLERYFKQSSTLQ